MAIPTSRDQPDSQMDNPGAAAIDIGSTVHMAAVNLLSGHMPVQALADWFANRGATSVAMEATGMKIIRTIVSGERDPRRLVGYRDVRCESSLETTRAALLGNDRAEHVFVP